MDERERALRDLRMIGEAVLIRLGEGKLAREVVYATETRYVKILGSCELRPGSMAKIKIQYPLWNLLSEEERYELVAHEHCHFAAWKVFGTSVDPHGIEWRSMMRFVGYENASASRELNSAANLYLNRKSMAPTNGKATLWVKDGYIFCRSPYSADFVQELKNDIHSSARVFLKVEKVWRVDAAYHEDLLSVVRKHYGEPTILEPDVKEVVVVEGASNDPFGAMLRVAPNEVLKKVYRMIAVEIHPDKGGKPEDMVLLNQAWDAVKKEKGM